MTYKIVYHKLGEMPISQPHSADNLLSAINYIINYVIDTSPPYDLDSDNKDDPWDRIIVELTNQKLAFIEEEEPDFIRYCLPNGYVIEAYANG